VCVCVCVCVCGVTAVVHTIPEGDFVVGVKSLGDEIYLLRWKPQAVAEVEVYDVITYHLQRCLTVPNARDLVDMTSCTHFLCLMFVYF